MPKAAPYALVDIFDDVAFGKSIEATRERINLIDTGSKLDCGDARSTSYALPNELPALFWSGPRGVIDV